MGSLRVKGRIGAETAPRLLPVFLTTMPRRFGELPSGSLLGGGLEAREGDGRWDFPFGLGFMGNVGTVLAKFKHKALI